MHKIYGFFFIVLVLFQPLICKGETFDGQNHEDFFVNHFDQAFESSEKNRKLFLKNLESEKVALNEIQIRIDQEREKISLYKNFLIVPQINISLLEKSLDEINVGISTINAKVDDLKGKLSKVDSLLAETDEKIKFSLNIINSVKDEEKETFQYFEEIKNYNLVLEEQKKILIQTRKTISAQIDLYIPLQGSLKDLAEIFKKHIKEKKGVILFQKEDIPFKLLSFKKFFREFGVIFKAVYSYFSIESFVKKTKLLQEHMNAGHVVSLVGFFLTSAFLFSGIRYFSGKDRYKNFKEESCGYPLVIIEKSSFILIAILFSEFFIRSKIYIVFPEFLKFIQEFLFVFLFTGIVSDCIRLITAERMPQSSVYILAWKNICVWSIRLYALIYLFLYSITSFENIVLTLSRVICEILLTAGVFLFWAGYKRIGENKEKIIFGILEWWSKGACLIGILAELAGYRYFTAWWFISWGITISVVCIVFLLYQSVENIDEKLRSQTPEKDENEKSGPRPFYWLFSRGAYFAIICIGLTGIAFAWGGGDVFLSWALMAFKKKYTIGKIELSLYGFVYGFIILFLTYLFTNFWKKMMKDHFLKESGLSTGAKDSVITISVYIVWSAGILISLSVFGLNSASMAFGFGALGIGLGFGLQNIFNNFISGLILLFERPIQVGDVVEVGGIWGEVEKINVRSTIVQTYTHSSLIIPNSEFISSQVTNWSHRDPFIRRDVGIGVSYSSDIELVEKLLIKATDKVMEIRLYPKKPIVQFINFGDNSLDFRVRFWSTVDDFVTAESKLRFAIVKLFRENGIEIPFPQRDIHIISEDKDTKFDVDYDDL